jgi:hypothetical protein
VTRTEFKVVVKGRTWEEGEGQERIWTREMEGEGAIKVIMGTG